MTMRPRILLAVLFALSSSPAFAHPVDEVVQGAYLTLAPGGVSLELDVTPGEKVAGAVLGALDPNGDGKVTDTEAKGYARKVLAQSTLTLDGKATSWTLDRVEVPDVALLRVGGGILKIYATAKRMDKVGTRTLSYVNRYAPAKSQPTANVFLQPKGGWTFAVTKQTRSNDGRSLGVTYTQGRS